MIDVSMPSAPFVVGFAPYAELLAWSAVLGNHAFVATAFAVSG